MGLRLKTSKVQETGKSPLSLNEMSISNEWRSSNKGPSVALEGPLESSLSVKCFRLLMWPESRTKAGAGAWLPDSNPGREGKPSLGSSVMSLSNILNRLTERSIVMTRHSFSSSWDASAVRQRDPSRVQPRRLHANSCVEHFCATHLGIIRFDCAYWLILHLFPPKNLLRMFCCK